MDAAGGGVLRRSKAAPASIGEQLLVEGIALEAESPWIGKIGSLQISSLTYSTCKMGPLAVLVATK